MIEINRSPSIRIVMIVVVALLLALTPASSAYLHAQGMATPVPEVPTEEPTTPDQMETPIATEPASTPTSEVPEETLPSTPTLGTPTSGPIHAATTMQPLSVPVQGSTGSLSGCTQSSASAPPGGTVAVRCTLTIRVGVIDNATGRVMRPVLSNGYRASIDLLHEGRSSSLSLGSTAANATLAMGAAGLGGSRAAAVSILISVPNSAGSGTIFAATFNSCRVSNVSANCYALDPQNGSVSVRISVASIGLVDGTHYVASCSAPNMSSVGFDVTAISNCQVTALAPIGNRTLLLENLFTTLNGASGWSGRLATADGVLTGTIPGVYNVIPAPPALRAGETFRWQVRLTPTACSAGNAPLVLGIQGNITPLLNGVPDGPTVTTNTRTVTVNFTPPATSSSGAVVSVPPIAASVPYSMTNDQTRSTSVTIQYTASGCAPWNGYAQMSQFVGVNTRAGGEVPVLESAEHGETIQSGPGFTTVTRQPIQTIGSSTATHILTGTRPGREVVIKHTIEIEYTIPANTPVGTYQSTITVSTTSAP